MNDSTAKPLRSQEWFGRTDKDGFIHRSWMKNQGLPHHVFDGRPAIGICNTFSELTPCNAHFRELAEYVKRGVWEAGGVPFEFPVMSLGETNLRPTAMLFRNLASMDVEESIRANPIDGVILLAGCDKTTPALLMGAASCNLPALMVSGGPMLRGNYKGRIIGSGTGVWQMSEEVRAGKMKREDFIEAESAMNRSRGHCMTMGTASTMASMVETLGIGLPGNAAIPAVDSRRQVLAHLAGRRIVEMVRENLTMDRILTPRGVRERHPRERRDRRLDQRGGAPARARRPHRRPPEARGLGARQRRALPRRPAAVRPVPDGGLLLCRRRTGSPPRAGRQRPAEQGRVDRQRQAPLGQRQGRGVHRPQRHHPLRQAVQAEGRHRRAAREPRAERRDHQAIGRNGVAAQASRPRRGVRECRGAARPRSTTRRSTWTRPACWC